MARMTNKRARALVNDWWRALKGTEPMPDDAAYEDYCEWLRREISKKHPERFVSREQALRWLRSIGKKVEFINGSGV